MSKKIVILNGSPRRNGNTSALVRAFSDGAEKAGNTVKEFFLDAMDIHGCKGCFGGHSSRECPCVQTDEGKAGDSESLRSGKFHSIERILQKRRFPAQRKPPFLVIFRRSYFFISSAPLCQAWPTFSPMA